MGEWEWAHAVIGGVATFIFLIQTFGTDQHDADISSDFSSGSDFDSGVDTGDATGTGPHFGGGFAEYLSVRNLVAFFVGYGWVTLTALLSGTSRSTASSLGICAGIVLVLVSLYFVKTFLKFQESGTIKMENLTGKRAVVYIAVGGSKSGAGKVMVDTASGRVELPARTNDQDVIPPGRLATILRSEDGVLWVTAKDELFKDGL